MPEKAETGVMLPGPGALNPVSATTNRLKPATLAGMKEIEMWQEAAEIVTIGLCVATWTYGKDCMYDGGNACPPPRLVQSSNMAFDAKDAAPTVEALARGGGGF